MERQDAVQALAHAIEREHPEGVRMPVAASNRERWARTFYALMADFALAGEDDPEILAQVREDAEALTATLEERAPELIQFAWDG